MDKDKASCSADSAKGACGTAPAAGACGTAKEKCCGKMLLSALVGGIVMFAWISVSWMMLPLHKNDFSGFKDEKAVAAAIGKNIGGDGIYVIPDTKMGKEKPKTTKPYAYVVVKAGGIDLKAAMNTSLIKEFLLCLFMAGTLACMLRKTAGAGCPVGFSAKTGLLVGVASYMPNYIWFHFPLNVALVGVFETLVAFVLAGFVISRCILKLPLGNCGQKTDCAKPACGTAPEEKK